MELAPPQESHLGPPPTNSFMCSFTIRLIFRHLELGSASYVSIVLNEHVVNVYSMQNANGIATGHAYR